ncbi:MAG: hypothetical protein A2351_07585 [Omnitrophica bacterium RIFOXYB12_FULL_50_7]|nr:MAG: hypothetical protein A2351_07585 [Omnitrophica bacterium RIFOXYB12_FULL_50_7]
MNVRLFFSSFIITVSIFVIFCIPTGLAKPGLASSKEAFSKIFQQGQIINQGTKFERQLRFGDAIAKYEEATSPQYLMEDRNKSYPLWRTNHIFRYQGEYQKALIGLDWFRQYGPKSNSLFEEEQKLKALIEWKNTGNKQSICEFINSIKNKYKDWFPPHKLVPISTTYMSDIAELYDLIGDYDSGIKWVESFREKDSKDKRTQDEYAALLRAFEESKQGMPKICGDDGKYCVGRATARLIQSDYF